MIDIGEQPRLIALEYSAFTVDGRSDLTMIVYTPATPTDAEKISGMMRASPALERA